MKKLTILLTALVICLSTSLIAQTHIWTGTGGDQEFSNPNNWDVMTVPGFDSDALISGPFDVLVTGIQLVGNLTLQNGVTFVVQGEFEVMDVSLINSYIEIDGVLTGNGFIEIDETSFINFKSGEINNAIFMNDGQFEVTELNTHDFNGVTFENNNVFRIFEANQVSFLNSTFLNLPTGIFDIESNGGFTQQSTSSILDNSGLIRKTPITGGSNGTFYMILEVNNGGIIEIPENETFLFLVSSITFTNGPGGRIIGDGVIDITQNFVNEGAVSPGDSDNIGSLDFTNTFNSTSPGVIEVDLMSPAVGEYDVIDVLGGPNLNAELDINVLQALNIGDSFPIITWSHSGGSCNFPASIIIPFGESQYNFDVICNPNDLTLELTEILLDVEDFHFNSSSFQIAPNPINETSTFLFSSEIAALSNPSIGIYNMLGQLVYENEELKESFVFERGNLSSGLYFAQIFNDGKLLGSKKVLLQ